MDVRILSTVSAAVSRPSVAAETVSVAPVAAAAEATPPVVQVQSDSIQQASNLGLFIANSSDEGLPRWKVLTALRVYGLNLKQGGERVAAEAASQHVEAPVSGESAPVDVPVAAEGAPDVPVAKVEAEA